MRKDLHDAWHTSAADSVAVPDTIARLARRARLSSWWNQSLTAMTLLGTAAWGAFQFTEGASLVLKILLALPFLLLAVACLLEFARYRARRQNSWSLTAVSAQRTFTHARRISATRRMAWLRVPARRDVADDRDSHHRRRPSSCVRQARIRGGHELRDRGARHLQRTDLLLLRMHMRRAAAIKQLELENVERMVGSAEASR